MTRRWIFQVLIIGAVWFLIAHLTEVERLGSVFRQGHWTWMLVAACVQLCYFSVFTSVYQSAFDTVGVRARVRDLLPVVFASIAVSVATRGIGGAALFVDDASRRGELPGRTAVGMLLSLVADLLAFTLVLIPGVLVLLSFHALEPAEALG